MEIKNNCVICQESLSKTTDYCIISCNHEFHASCLFQIRKNDNCPICRSKIVPDNKKIGSTFENNEANINAIVGYNENENNGLLFIGNTYSSSFNDYVMRKKQSNLNLMNYLNEQNKLNHLTTQDDFEEKYKYKLLKDELFGKKRR